MIKHIYILSILALASISNAQLVIQEFVYDVCNGSALADGSGTNGGEYVLVCNSGVASIALANLEFDDDGDCTDGDGAILPAGAPMLAPGSCAVISPNTQTGWESEYGALPGAYVFVSTAADWDSLNNGGDNICVQGASNNGVYTDLVDQGEAVIWDGTAFAAGGVVSIHPSCGPQTQVVGNDPCALTAQSFPGFRSQETDAKD